MINAVIVDDELRARETIRQILTSLCPHVKIVGEAESVESGFNVISQQKPDAVFLDMQMNDGTGFDLLKRFPTINFKFVIVTAFQEFAIRAFKFSAIDYLLKPLDPTELVSAVEKLEKTQHTEEINQNFKTFIENSQAPEGKPQKIILRSAETVDVVNIMKIVRCESQSNYTNFYLTDGTKIMVSRTLKEYDDLLSSSGFLRVHQSHLVNIQFIKTYKRFPESHITLSDNTYLPVAVRKRELVEEMLKKKRS